MMNRPLSSFAAAFLFLTFLASSAAGQSVESALNQQFTNKVLVLLHPAAGDSLRFESGGNSADARPAEPWTVYGGVRIRKIQLDSGKLRIEGRRVFFRFNSGQPVPFDFDLLKNRGAPPCQPAVKIEIKLDQPLDSLDRANAVLSKVFAFDKQAFVGSLPEWWRAYVTRNVNFDAVRVGELEYTAPPPIASSQRLGAPATMAQDDDLGPEVFKVGGDVKRPKAIYIPEPEFSEAARYEKYKGVVVLSIVVDKAGHIAQVKIIRALGFGLDDQAAKGVMGWRFDPATRNAEPVAVAMNVEVAFNLY
jgi:TonB family protein